MASDRFPYDLPAFDAMVTLVQETKPSWRIQRDYVRFQDVQFQPTAEIPGRTYIEMIDMLANAKRPLVYRRLDLGIVLGNNYTITLTGVPTPRAIAKEVNRTKLMFLDEDTVDFSTTPIGDGITTFQYTLEAKPGAYVYYGSTNLIVQIAQIPTNARLLEGGDLRLLEAGDTRLLDG